MIRLRHSSKWALSLMLLLIMLTIAACTEAPPPPTPIISSASVVAGNNVIQWVRSPEYLTFRADISGGARENTFEGLRDVPSCSIYGDNRVVWVNELGINQTEVLYDIVPDEQIANFIAYLTINERVYTYQAIAPTAGVDEPSPVIERINLNVNGIQHHADGFSGWNADWFPRILQRCKTLSATPILFEPTAAWVTVEKLPSDNLDTSAPMLRWEATSGIDFSAMVSGEAAWVTSPALLQLWRQQNSQSSRLIYMQGEEFYRVAIQVPGISRVSPPAPSGR